MNKAKRESLDIVLFYVEDKKKHKIKDMEFAIGVDEDAQMKAYTQLTESNTSITYSDVINSMEMCDIQDALPIYVNHKI